MKPQAFNSTPLIPGMRCMIVGDRTHSGKVIALAARRPTVVNSSTVNYWSTTPVLRGKDANGEEGALKWAPSSLMPLGEPKLHSQLNLERREECKTDPRMAYYILGKDAAYNWKRNNPGAAAG